MSAIKVCNELYPPPPWPSPRGCPTPTPWRDRTFLHHFSHGVRKIGGCPTPRGWRDRTFFAPWWALDKGGGEGTKKQHKTVPCPVCPPSLVCDAKAQTIGRKGLPSNHYLSMLREDTLRVTGVLLIVGVEYGLRMGLASVGIIALNHIATARRFWWCGHEASFV
jgi:hypothetical protein